MTTCWEMMIHTDQKEVTFPWTDPFPCQSGLGAIYVLDFDLYIFPTRHSSTLYNVPQNSLWPSLPHWSLNLQTQLLSSSPSSTPFQEITLRLNDRITLLPEQSLTGPQWLQDKTSCFAKPHTSSSLLCGPLYTLDICSFMDSNVFPCCHASVYAGPLAQKSLSKTLLSTFHFCQCPDRH